MEPLAAGTVIGDFVVVDELGRGGMSCVHRARRTSGDGGLVALKVVRDDGDDPRVASRLRREASALLRISHPHVVEFLASGAERAWIYVAMDLVDGPTLQDVLERLSADRRVLADPWVRRRLVEKIAQLADGLAAVHRAGLIHRDVKPGNVVFRGHGRSLLEQLGADAVLVDFGLARPAAGASALTTAGIPLTLQYASPEQLSSRPLDARSDVFSLGVTMHDLLSGRNPSDRECAAVGLEPIEQLVTDLDPDLAQIVGAAVDVKTEWRYPDAGAFHDDLAAWLRGAPVRAAGLVRRARAVGGTRRRRWLTAVAALGLVVSACFVVAWIGPFRDPDQRQDSPVARASESSFATALSAATQFERDPGVPDVPLRTLAGFVDRGSTLPEDQRFDVVALLARLFVERPIRSATLAKAAAPLRDALGVLVAELQSRQDDAARVARLDAIAALGGCGLPGICTTLLESAREAGRPNEERRLILAAVERILRRASECGLAVEIDDAEVITCFEIGCRVLPERTAADLDECPNLVRETWSLVKAAAFFARRRRIELAWSVVPRDSLEPNQCADFDCIARSPEAVEIVAIPPAWQLLDATEFRRAGWRCQALGSPERTNAWIQALSERFGPHSSADAEFERGRQACDDEMRGVIDELDVDPTTTLAAETDADSTMVLVSASRAAASLLRADELAAFDFAPHARELGGGAESIRARGITSASGSDSSSAIFQSLGGSRLELRFKADRSGVPVLELEHLKADRRYLPHQGTVRIEVAYDDEPLPILDVRDDSWHLMRVPAPRVAAAGTDHRFTIRATDRSTTTYRLRHASIFSRE
jgi:serine/threonine protein kinase